MIVGSFAPWGKTVGLLNVSISGTDGSNDGWLVVGAAIAGAGGLVMHSHGKRIAALGPLLAGAAASYVTYHDRGNLTDAANENTSDYVALQVGWGLNLAMGASIVLGVVALVALLGNQDSPGMKVPAVESETEHEFDHPASGSPSRTNQAGIPTAPPGSGATFRKAKRQKHP